MCVLWTKVRVLNSLKRVRFHHMMVYSNLNLILQTGTGKKTNLCKILRGYYIRELAHLVVLKRKQAWKYLLNFLPKVNWNCTRNTLFPVLFGYFQSSMGLASNCYDFIRFPIRIWLNNYSLKWAGAVWQCELVHLEVS